jgi:hypothetical protein
VDDPVSTTEAIRLFNAGHKNTIARWENVYRMWQEHKPLSHIAWWIGKSESTVRQLLKRAHIHRMQMGNPWPVDSKGRKICDIPHPMTQGDNPMQWCHTREFRLTGPGRWFCPVCKRAYSVGRPLIEVLLDDMKYDNARTGTTTGR